MKLSEKAIMIAIVTFAVFILGTMLLGNLIGLIFSSGEDAINSYFYFLLAGEALLASLLVGCTYYMVKKK